MENNENIIKAMGICMAPGCSAACPYNGKGNGTKSCRAVLLEDAIAALVGEMADNETLNGEVDDLEAVANTLRAERDGMRAERDAYANECKALTLECKNLAKERDKLEAALHYTKDHAHGKQGAKTDRPSVGFDGSLAYWCGRADALAEVVSSIVGEASGHE